MVSRQEQYKTTSLDSITKASANIHAQPRNAVMRNAFACSWNKMLTSLLQGRLSCKSCSELLESCAVDIPTLRARAQQEAGSVQSMSALTPAITAAANIVAETPQTAPTPAMTAAANIVVETAQTAPTLATTAAANIVAETPETAGEQIETTEPQGLTAVTSAEDLRHLQDPMRWIEWQAPTLQVMPPGFRGCAVPIRCTICTSKSQPKGKVFDVRSTVKSRLIWSYVQQHLGSQIHVRNMALQRTQQEAVVPAEECHGLNLLDPDLSAVAPYAVELDLWAAHTDPGRSRVGEHRYWKADAAWRVQHKDCAKAAQSGSPCLKCRSLGDRKSVLRLVLRFAFKYHAAKLLSARLFGGSEMVHALHEELKVSSLYQRHESKMVKLLSLKDAELQNYVRYGFRASVAKTEMPPVLTHFAAAVVAPCLKVNVWKAGSDNSALLSQLSAYLASGRLTDMEEINARIASAAISGQLESHPLLQGLIVSVMQMLEKSERGIRTLRGRPQATSETACALVADAGLSLALAGGNIAMARQFGQRVRAGQVSFDKMDEHDLPRPALALRFEGALQDNMERIDRRLPSTPRQTTRRLFLAFDCTYLQPALTQASVQGQIGLVGGAWGAVDQCFMALGENLDLKRIRRARQMCLGCSLLPGAAA